MNATSLPALAVEAAPYVAVQRTMHDALLVQHPEWIERDGNCPTCDDYDRRFAKLLDFSLASNALAHTRHMQLRSASRYAVILAALLAFSGCASTRVASPDHLPRDLAAAEVSYRELAPNHTNAYNTALASIVRDADLATPALLHSELRQAGVKLDEPAVELPLVRYHAVRTSPQPKQSLAIGAPVLLEYDTSRAPIYPREGMFLSATAIYRRVQNQPHLSFIAADDGITLGRKSYPLVTDKNAATSMLARRARRVAQSGLTNLLHPELRAKGEIVLSQPYDPNKIPILLVHGLQTTPFTFLQLVNALESDPEIARRFQFWHFYYSTGTPVLLNALRLREELERTLQIVDPEDADFATHHIVVLGHSMGGLIAHTLVSSSGDRLWRSLFVVPPEQLRGNPEMAQRLQRAFFFRRNPRVVRAVFVATPHHGSAMADSWIGGLAKSLIRLPDKLQTGLTDIAEKNAEIRTAEAAAFFKELNFTSVHMLSPHDPMLLALARLPIAVPFHSIMGEKHNGAGSDGVVRYASSHLDGANSELIVRSGHNAFNNPEARSEVIRILREELQRSPAPRRAPAAMLAGYAEKRNIVFHKSAARREDFDMKKTKIVIAGGGFAGLYAAKYLDKHLARRPDIEVTLIARENFILFTPMLHEVAAGDLAPGDIVNPLRRILRHVNVIEADVTDVDLSARKIRCVHGLDRGELEFEFDHLLLALGSETNFFDNAGIRDWAVTMKNLSDATLLRNRVVAFLEEASLETDAAARRQWLTFVIAGGGFAGAETAGAVNDFVRETAKFYPHLADEEIRVVVIHPGDHLLPELGEELGRYAERKMRERKVEVIKGARVASYDGWVVTLNNGLSIPAATLIWTAGVKPSPVVAALPCPKEKGRIAANEYLQVPGFTGLWTAGDCAAVPDVTASPARTFFPPTAQHGMREAIVAAKNIERTILGEPLQPFRYRTMGMLASIGHHTGVASFFGFKFSGFIAWWMWRSVYLAKLPRLVKKLRVMIAWTLDLLFGRDIEQMITLRDVEELTERWARIRAGRKQLNVA